MQPVWNRYCVSCHDYGKPAGERLNLAGDLGPVFNTSYVELRRKGFVNVVGAGPFQELPPKSWGSHASPLVHVLLNGHGVPAVDAQVQIDRDSIDRIVTWIDINAPYYPEYSSAYPNNRYGRCPLNDQQMTRLKELTGSTDVNFTRPEFSVCLAKFTDPADPNYHEAFAIIQSGQAALAQTPRRYAGFSARGSQGDPPTGQVRHVARRPSQGDESDRDGAKVLFTIESVSAQTCDVRRSPDPRASEASEGNAVKHFASAENVAVIADIHSSAKTIWQEYWLARISSERA